MEAHCLECDATRLMVEEAVYEGFTKVGVRRTCTVCGAEQQGEASELVSRGQDEASAAPVLPPIFSEEDRSPEIRIAGQDEAVEMCRHCRHYLVNPFTQRCGLHEREVAATDSCSDFARMEERES